MKGFKKQNQWAWKNNDDDDVTDDAKRIVINYGRPAQQMRTLYFRPVYGRPM